MKPTIKMIAEKAGVSIATVSNALNNKRGVSPETILLINQIASEIGYGEHSGRVSSGRSLKGIRAIRLVTFRKHGLVVQDTPFFSELIHSIEAECTSQGLELIFAQIQAWEEGDCRRLEQLLQDSNVATILLATEMEEEDLSLLSQVKAPLLLLDSYFPTGNWQTVSINNYEAGLRATRYLMDQGHRSIGMITSSHPFNNMKYRYLGYKDALEDQGVSVDSRYLVHLEPTLEGSFRDMSVWLSDNRELPTAFFAANDAMAAGAVRALQEHGVRVPEQVSIIGMDDLPICLALNPPLTTMHVYKEVMAQVAVRQLLDLIQFGCPTHCLIEVGVDLMERKSVCFKEDT